MKTYSLSAAITYNRRIRKVGETEYYFPNEVVYSVLDVSEGRYELEPVIETLDRDAVYEAIHEQIDRFYSDLQTSYSKGTIVYTRAALAKLFPDHTDKKL